MGAVLASTGGVRAAVLSALSSATFAGSLSSGLHHARRDRGYGYCTVNGLVVGAVAAQANGAGRVLIVDFDAHCGGGTAGLIDGLDGIEQIDVSVNSFDSYESRPDAKLVLSSATTYLDDVEAALDAVPSPTSIDLVIYNAGMDPHERAGGVRGIDAEILAAREQRLFEWASALRLPVAWVLAGGYTGAITMDELVELHRLTITAAASNSEAH
jgi:acetoin utilization deacetylase AcuC-like enzyme